MHIVMLAAEMQPYCKTGGLADVLGALPGALAAVDPNVHVTTVLPFHSQCRQLPPLTPRPWRITVPMGKRTETVLVHRATLAARHHLCLVEHACFMGRDGLYAGPEGDYADNPWRFLLLSKACLRVVTRLRPAADILHIHDWHGGMAAFLASLHHLPLPTVFTVHNLGYQGNVDPAILEYIDPEAHRHFHIDGIEFYGKVSFMKAGLMYADQLTTVSPTHAREILTPEFGFGMDGVLRRREADLCGILNGVDYDEWSPAIDSLLPSRYDLDDMTGKTTCKSHLQELMGLPCAPAKPVIAFIGRLAAQKGVDLLLAAAPALLGLDTQWIILGAGHDDHERTIAQLASAHPDKFAARLAFNPDLAHLIVAGADLLLMPSQYEACGLSQLYSMRYGTVPVVRAVGGLHDSVRDPHESSRPTGFKFAQYSTTGLMAALRRALTWFADPERWAAIRSNGMREDFSWKAAAHRYLGVYLGLRGPQH